MCWFWLSKYSYCVTRGRGGDAWGFAWGSLKTYAFCLDYHAKQCNSNYFDYLPYVLLCYYSVKIFFKNVNRVDMHNIVPFSVIKQKSTLDILYTNLWLCLNQVIQCSDGFFRYNPCLNYLPKYSIRNHYISGKNWDMDCIAVM